MTMTPDATALNNAVVNRDSKEAKRIINESVDTVKLILEATMHQDRIADENDWLWLYHG